MFDQDLVIDKGLEQGETVVTEGQLRLAPGSTVQLREPNGGGGRDSGGGRGRGRGRADKADTGDANDKGGKGKEKTE